MLANGTVSFNGASYSATSISVESAVAEIANMTGAGAQAGAMVLKFTGDYTSPGSFTFEAIGFANPDSLVGQRGTVSFSGASGSISKTAICESGSVEGRVGDLLRVRLKFIPTSG